ncbi:unnamed protein product, partial [Brugia timori]|uniref:Secreted protein n=1 Tax=Brugia timori TaxID=42155 RepID=A0A0R3Q5H7_9BILA
MILIQAHLNSSKYLFISQFIFLFKYVLFTEMMIVKPAALFSAFVSTVYTLQNPLISAPFDNFRIECAKSSGTVGISVRMVGSQGFIRQDTVFAIICERVDEV